MDYSKLGLFSLIGQKISFIGQRHNVLANNIANLDTPHFKAKDLKEIDFSQMVKGNMGGRLQLATTAPGHISSPAEGEFGTEEVKGWDPKPNGNNVDPVDQASKMSDNATDYQSVTSIYAKMADLIRTVVSDR